MSQLTSARRDAPVIPLAGEVASVQPADDGACRNRWIRRSLPTATVLAILAGLALWGHATDWTLPSFSALLGRDNSQADNWCKEHNVTESQCIECKAGLIPVGKEFGWGKKHGVAECPLEHPEIAQLVTPPVITSADLERAERALALMPRIENNRHCKSYRRRIQFDSTAAIEKAGVDIAVVVRRPMIEAVVANGEVVFDETRLAHLSSRVTGTVWRVEKQVGENVENGDILALVDSSEVGRAKGELLQSLAQVRFKQTTLNRLGPLATNASIPERTYREADAALQEMQIRLLTAKQTMANLGLPLDVDEFAELRPDEVSRRIQFLGLPTALADSLDGVATSNLFPLRASLDGTVVERNVVAGEVIDAAKTLFTVTDTGHVWLTLAVRQDEAKFVSLGQPVLFRPSGNKDAPEIKGGVSWISAAADNVTRTVKVRVDLPNADGRLRANTFGSGRIVLRDEPSAIVVPSEAVHSDGDCNVVFVRDKDYLRADSFKFFHVREVRSGIKQGDMTEIIVGLLPGEVIASKNSVVLEAQLLKSNLGAGCGCADGH
jgi:cobalt-zinc-cadmium efflux system membrane fusion protein